MKDVEIFTGPMCGYCTAAKALLDQLSMAYTERNVKDPEVMKEMRERLPTARTIPQIFIDGEHVGGYDDLRAKLG